MTDRDHKRWLVLGDVKNIGWYEKKEGLTDGGSIHAGTDERQGTPFSKDGGDA